MIPDPPAISSEPRKPSTFEVTLKGFKTKEQALEFLKWYEGGGEQQFYDHLSMVGKSPDDGCNIDVHHKGNSGCYDVTNNGYIARVN